MACGFFEYIDKNGQIVRGFQCGYRLPNGELESPEDRWIRGMIESQEYEIECREEARRHTALNDPNRIDSRNVRREFRDEPRGLKTINLGMRANRMPANARRI